MSYFVYHIKKPEMELTEGYIGISNNPERRFYEHTKANTYVGRAIKKHKDIQIKILLECEEWYALEIEEKLRPQDKLGWNIAKGGGMPPNIKNNLEAIEKIKDTNKAQRHLWTKKCEAFDYKTNESLGVFDSLKELADALSISGKTICRTAKADRSKPSSRNNRHHHKGVYMKYIGD